MTQIAAADTAIANARAVPTRMVPSVILFPYLPMLLPNTIPNAPGATNMPSNAALFPLRFITSIPPPTWKHAFPIPAMTEAMAGIPAMARTRPQSTPPQPPVATRLFRSSRSAPAPIGICKANAQKL